MRLIYLIFFICQLFVDKIFSVHGHKINCPFLIVRQNLSGMQDVFRTEKLAPYAEQIKLWKNKGMTLREIAAELQKYGC